MIYVRMIRRVVRAGDVLHGEVYIKPNAHDPGGFVHFLKLRSQRAINLNSMFDVMNIDQDEQVTVVGKLEAR